MQRPVTEIARQSLQGDSNIAPRTHRGPCSSIPMETTIKMPIRMLLLLILTCLVGSASAQHRGFYNEPDIHGDTIVFTSEGDLWSVLAKGGLATRLTSDAGMELHPRISPDGMTVAFAAQYDGNLDVYTMPITGGVPTRLTWAPMADLPSDWTPDGKSILYFTPQSHPHYARETYIIPAGGGVPQKFPIGTSCFAVLAPDGETVAFNRTYVQRRTWKRYGGGLADDIWIGNVRNGEFEQLTTYFGNDLTPLFVKDRLFFLSERSGRMNLWSMNAEGKDLTQHTQLDDFDVQFTGTDGERIVFQHGGDIHVYTPATGESVRVDILLPTDRPRTRLQMPEVGKNLDDYSISNDGRKLAIGARGDLFNVPAKTGRVSPLTDTRGAREVGVKFAGKEDEFVVYMSDESGNYELYRADAKDGRNAERLTDPDDPNRGFLQPFFPLSVSPDGAKVAFADQRATLYWIGTTTPTLTVVDSGGDWETRGYQWSPDNRYLAFEKHRPNGYVQLYIHDTESGENHAATDEFQYSFSPAWDPEGKYLFFLSDRTMNRENGNFEYEVVMVEPTLVYALPLNNDVDNPFRPKDPYEEDAEKELEKENDKKDTKKDDDESTETLKLEIVFEGLMERAIPFPMDSGDYDSLSAVKEKVFFVSRGEKRDLMAYAYTKEKPEAKVWKADIEGYALSRNGEHLVYRSKDTLRVAEAKADKAGDDDATPALDRVNLLSDPLAEWRQMFNEVYRYNRDYFYDAEMARNDWEKIAETYRPLLERLSIRQELTELIGNMIGELGHGHTYVMGDGDAPGGRTVETGLLGADFGVDDAAGRVTLAKIYRGQRWASDLQSPLADRRLADVKDGWYLLKVNGQAVTTAIDPLSHFWGLARRDVLLTLSPTADEKDARDFRVTLLADENALRYDEWVRSRRTEVDRLSGGTLGYIHLPNMGDRGLNSFFSQYYGQIRKEGLVVDIRWNGGGNVSQLLIRRLNHQLYAMMKPRNFPESETYPMRVFTGPMAALINERCGSDGDIFARSFEHFGMGPLIGTTTWGGVVGIRSHTRLMDGGRISVPEFSFIDLERGYGIENYGIEPTKGFRVQLEPEDELSGRDPQLVRAVEYLMAEKGKPEYQRPGLPASPDRSVPSFTERSREWMRRP